MMRRLLPGPVIAVLTVVSMFIWLMIWGGAMLVPVAIVKILMPVPALKRRLTSVAVWIANVPWIRGNRAIYTALHGARSNRSFDPLLDPSKSWLIVGNHQSWADILILFDAFSGRAPFPRFFLKKELIWVPLIGFICWAVDMPFMQRNSRKAAAGNAALRNKDLETTRRFCEKYRRQPITVVNFAEGTRCNEAKRIGRRSPYRHLLRPKSAGLSFMLNAMGEQFAGIIDLTIIYQPTRRSKLGSFLCGEQSGAHVLARVIDVPADLMRGDYAGDAEYRMRFQTWINVLWAEKDALLARHQAGTGRPAAVPSPVAARHPLP